jgi:hypothetical protein
MIKVYTIFSVLLLLSCAQKQVIHTFNPNIHTATIQFPHNGESWHPQPRVREFRSDQEGRKYLEIVLQDSYAYDLN